MCMPGQQGRDELDAQRTLFSKPSRLGLLARCHVIHAILKALATHCVQQSLLRFPLVMPHLLFKATSMQAAISPQSAGPFVV